MAVSVLELVFVALSLMLAFSGAALVYPALAGVQVVLYRRGAFLLGVSAFVFIVGWLLGHLSYYGVVSGAWVDLVVYGSFTVAAVIHFVAIWHFARDFVEFGREEPSVRVVEEHEGFDTGFDEQ